MFRANKSKQVLTSFLLGFFVASVLPAQAEDASSVVSLQNSNPTSKDIIGAFMNKPAAEDDLPEGLMDGIGEGGSEVKYRGISFSKKPKPEMAEPKSIAESEPVSQPAGCPTNNAIAVNINFQLNSAQINNNNMDLLNEISKAMNSPELSACNFIVEGHTDAQGDAAYNMHLSKSRAEAVKNFLASAKVSYSRLRVIGKGESELMDTDNPNDGINRRVQFRIGN
ncbi:MAG: OmpA family protein [Pseudomonadota bacterium]